MKKYLLLLVLLSALLLNGSCGKRDRMIIKAYSDNLIPVQNDDHQYGYFNKKGEAVIDYQYRNAFQFYKGLAIVQDFEKNYYLINNKNEKVVGPYENIYFDAQYNVYTYRVDGEKDLYGLIDKKGKALTEAIYEEIGLFNRGVATYEKDGKYGVISVKGKEITEPLYGYISDFIYGLAYFSIEDGIGGFINKKGKEITERKYSYGYVTSPTSMGAEIYDKEAGKTTSYVLNNKGKVTFTSDKDDSLESCGQYFQLCHENESGDYEYSLINTKGKVVFEKANDIFGNILGTKLFVNYKQNDESMDLNILNAKGKVIKTISGYNVQYRQSTYQVAKKGPIFFSIGIRDKDNNNTYLNFEAKKNNVKEINLPEGAYIGQTAYKNYVVFGVKGDDFKSKQGVCTKKGKIIFEANYEDLLITSDKFIQCRNKQGRDCVFDFKGKNYVDDAYNINLYYHYSEEFSFAGR